MLERSFGFPNRLDWPAVDLPLLQEKLDRSLRDPDAHRLHEEAVYARLRDVLEPMDLKPPDQSTWHKACTGRFDLAVVPWEKGKSSAKALDPDAWRRLRALVEGLTEPQTGEVFRQRCVDYTVGSVCTHLLPGFALWSEDLRMDLLSKNPFRVEEFARKWIDALGAAIAGETAAASEKRLREVDFSGSIARVERARAEADLRRRLQEEQERRDREEYERYQRE